MYVNLPRLYSSWQSKNTQNAAVGKKFDEYKITWCDIKNQLACQGLPTPGLKPAVKKVEKKTSFLVLRLAGCHQVSSLPKRLHCRRDDERSLKKKAFAQNRISFF